MSNTRKEVEKLLKREFIVIEGSGNGVEPKDFRFGALKDVRELIDDLVENQSEIETLISFHMDTRGYTQYRIAGRYTYVHVLGALEIIKTKVLREMHGG
ncbi:hypothetical protein LCGC14_0338020 [marine sediment metagenome]|uniref:Uncharacterized protein n=1 Tax=marine sediment metagenome TaxID=412755 RepID=A0A0F9WLY1_9ZZZZ